MEAPLPPDVSSGSDEDFAPPPPVLDHESETNQASHPPVEESESDLDHAAPTPAAAAASESDVEPAPTAPPPPIATDEIEDDRDSQPPPQPPPPPPPSMPTLSAVAAAGATDYVDVDVQAPPSMPKPQPPSLEETKPVSGTSDKIQDTTLVPASNEGLIETVQSSSQAAQLPANISETGDSEQDLDLDDEGRLIGKSGANIDAINWKEVIAFEENFEVTTSDSKTNAITKITESKLTRVSNWTAKTVKGKTNEILYNMAHAKEENKNQEFDSKAPPDGSSGKKRSYIEKYIEAQRAGPSQYDVVPVDTVKKVDLIGTQIKDVGGEIAAAAEVGQNTASNPLDIPWILMAFPVAPIGVMIAYTVLKIILPILWVIFLHVFLIFGWRIFVYAILAGLVGLVLSWDSLRHVDALKPVTLQIDLQFLQMKEKMTDVIYEKLKPSWKSFKKNFQRPFLHFLERIDKKLRPRLGYSLYEKLMSIYYGWRWEPLAQDLVYTDKNESAKYLTTEELINRMIEGSYMPSERFSEQEEHELFYDLSFELLRIENLFSDEFKGVWVEWWDNGQKIDSCEQVDTETTKVHGTYANLHSFVINHEIRMPYYPYVKSSAPVHDVPIELRIKGRKVLPLYGNDGKRRFVEGTNTIYELGRVIVSAKKIGAGRSNFGETVFSDLRIPFLVAGQDSYSSCSLICKAKIQRVQANSYSFRNTTISVPTGEWTCRLHVHELRSLKAADDSGSSDPFVRGEVFGISKDTKVTLQTLNCVIDEILNFSAVRTVLQLKTDKIVIRVMDYNFLAAPVEIGKLILDGKKIWNEENSEVVRQWFPIVNSRTGKFAGHIRLSIACLAPGELPKVHDASEDREDLSKAKLLKSSVVIPPEIRVENWAVHIVIGWADGLPRMTSHFADSDIVRGFCEILYSGHPPLETSTFSTYARIITDPRVGEEVKITPLRRIIFNEEIVVPFSISAGKVLQEGIDINLYHRTSGNSGNKLIGSVHIGFDDIINHFHCGIIRGQSADGEKPGDRKSLVSTIKPKYYNFYGSPEGTASPLDKRTAYRGRFLLGIGCKPGFVKECFMRPAIPPPRPKVAMYTIIFCPLRAANINVDDKCEIEIEGRVGIYSFGHTIPRRTLKNHGVEWDQNCLLELKNLQLPDEVDDIPDLFINIWGKAPTNFLNLGALDEAEPDMDIEPSTVALNDTNQRGPEWKRLGYLILPAKHLLLNHKAPTWRMMDLIEKGGLTDGNIDTPGNLLCLVRLSKDFTIQKMNLDQLKQEKSLVESKSRSLTPFVGEDETYCLKVWMAQGRNLAASDASGLSDAFFTIWMGNDSLKGGIVCKQTCCPIWEEEVKLENVVCRKGERLPPVDIKIFDWDNDGAFDFLGRALIDGSEVRGERMSVAGAEWYDVFTSNPGSTRGQILADFEFVKSKDVSDENALTYSIDPHDIKRSDALLRISILGLRDVEFLRFASGTISISLAIPGNSDLGMTTKPGVILARSEFSGNCNILDIVFLKLRVADDLRLAPTVSIIATVKYGYRNDEEILGTASINLEDWLRLNNNNMLSQADLMSGDYGINDGIPEWLLSKKYIFDENALVKEKTVKASLQMMVLARQFIDQAIEKADRETDDDSECASEIGYDIGTLYALGSRKKKENKTDLRVGFPEKEETKLQKKLNKIKADLEMFGKKMQLIQAKARDGYLKVFDAFAQVMPDVSFHLGLPEYEENPLLIEEDSANLQVRFLGSTILVREKRGFCDRDLETDFNAPTYNEYALYRGQSTIESQDMDFNEFKKSIRKGLAGNSDLIDKELRRTQLEGGRPAIAKLKARFDLVEQSSNRDDLDDEDNESTSEMEIHKARLMSLRSFGKLYTPSEVIVRVYILCAHDLQQVGSICNPYLTVHFYGGYPEYYSTKNEPVLENSSPNFYMMFESRVKMPGGTVEIAVKDRELPEASIPLTYPAITSDDGYPRLGIARAEVGINAGKLGISWSEFIGQTNIDLDSRWYNSAWRSLKVTPVEFRSLRSDVSTNSRGNLEMFMDIIDAKEYERQPLAFKPHALSLPLRKRYQLRLTIFRLEDCFLPYQKAAEGQSVLASFYVRARLGNKPREIRETDKCKFVPDGTAEFNYRMYWWIGLPNTTIKPRLKLQIFNDTSSGLGNDDLCATVDISLRGMFESMLETNDTILRKKQWVMMRHPGHPEVSARIQIAIEFLPEREVGKKKCYFGRSAQKASQYPDYVLERPFRPAKFNILNPQPFFNYLIVSSVKMIQWQAAMYLLLFPFLPMGIHLITMVPWWWYLMGGMSGLVVFLRLFLVEMSRAPAVHIEDSDDE